MRRTLFASDLHLSSSRPALVAAFRALCAGVAREAEALYLLGDIFDYWVGDDQLREPLGREVAAAIRDLTSAGVRVAFLRGNRDFLAGERLATATGAELLPDEIVVDLYGRPTLLLHGDELCTADVAYQRFRAWSRREGVQAGFLALPYALRHTAARLMRRESRRAKAEKPAEIMDVTPEAVAEAFRRHDVDRMIHGHTHRPAVHRIVVDGRERERWVLADWYDRATVLAVTSEGAEMLDVANP